MNICSKFHDNSSNSFSRFFHLNHQSHVGGTGEIKESDTVCSAFLLLLVTFHSPHPCSTPASQPHSPHQLILFTWALSCSSSVNHLDSQLHPICNQASTYTPVVHSLFARSSFAFALSSCQSFQHSFTD